LIKGKKLYNLNSFTNKTKNKMQKTQNDQGNQNSGSLLNQKTETSETEMTETQINNGEATKTYTCSMHPEVISDKPGKCPKCGMELIEK
jgi:rubrerythrin